MSKIEQLIQQLCPEGVEYKRLHELTTWDKRFNGVDKSMQPKTISYPYLLAKDLISLEVANGDVRLLETGISKDLKWTTEEKAGDYVCEGEIVAIPWGGTPNVKYYKGKFVTADNRIATANDKSILSNKYLYYWMANNIDTIAKLYRGAGIQHPSMAGVLNLEIPLPPLPVQQEIVRILDAFTQLEAELEAELEARKKQYAYYRDTLLSFEHDDPKVEWKRLVDVANVQYGYPFDSSLFTEDDSYIPIIRIRDIITAKASTYYKGAYDESYIVKKGDILVGMDGNFNLEKWNDRDSLLNQRVCKIYSNSSNKVLDGFLYHLLKPEFKHIEGEIQGGTVIHLSAARIKKILIPLPPLPVQQEIVRKLDKFSAITSDLQSGLPAEMEARRKQYEYYRDQLLSFKVKN